MIQTLLFLNYQLPLIFFKIYNIMSSTITISNPVPILQQPKADLTTNPFISGTTPTQQISTQQTTPQISTQQISTQQTTTPQSTQENDSSLPGVIGFTDFNKKMSNSIMGIMDDMYEKPNDVSWQEYIPYVVGKESRYNYLGVTIIFIIMFIILFS